MKKKTIGYVLARIPMEGVQFLRHKGGFHSSPKGKKGYSRKKIAKPDQDDLVFYLSPLIHLYTALFLLPEPMIVII